MQRDNRIDFLRFVGLAMVIFAHVNPPDLLFQIRDFDVPLMVFVSALSFGVTYKTSQSYVSYLWKRIKRLLFPVWIFLTIYFSAEFLVFPTSLELNFNTILATYALIDGIGYVWIIRVFLLVALVAPIIFLLNSAVRSNLVYFSVIIIPLCIYEYLRAFHLEFGSAISNAIVINTFFYLIPFSFIFALALRMLTMSPAQIRYIIISSFFTYAACQVFFAIKLGHLQYTFNYKYPPAIFYLSYSVIVSSCIWLLSERICSSSAYTKFDKVLGFLSGNTIWIYLWHIPFVKVVHLDFLTKYVVVFFMAVSICFIQVQLVKWFVRNFVKSERASRNIKTIFTG